MTQPATTLPLTPRERLRWRRAMDALLIDSIYGRIVRDVALPDRDPVLAVTAMAGGTDYDPAVAIA